MSLFQLTKGHLLRHLLLYFICLICHGSCFSAQGQSAGSLPRSKPSDQGLDPVQLSNFVRSLDEQIQGMHSLMILRHGMVVAEGWWAPYRAEDPHVLYSLSKSFTSTALGMAVSEGRLSIDDRLVDLFPDQVPKDASGNLKAMRVRDLLTMTTGHQEEPPISPDEVSVASFMRAPVPHLPGTHFKYNTAATFMQSAIVHHLTQTSLLDYLQPRFFKPLGIENPVWDSNAEGIALGGYGLRARTEDIAKLGQLYLQKGRWGQQVLLAEDWVQLATSKQVSNGSHPDNDWNQGYGFQFWRCRHDAFRGDGAFGQYCVVLPKLDVVLAITSGVSDMQATLNMIWDQFLPACLPVKRLKASTADAALQKSLSELKIPGVQGKATSSAFPHQERVFRLEENPDGFKYLRLSQDADSQSLLLSLEGAETHVQLCAGYQGWKRGTSDIPVGRLAHFQREPIAGTYAWENPQKLVMKVCATQTPFHLLVSLAFDGEVVEMNWASNVAFGKREKETLQGRAMQP